MEKTIEEQTPRDMRDADDVPQEDAPSAGPNAVSGDVEGQLADYNVRRLWGETAIDTSAEIVTWELGQGMTAEGMSVATGYGYWDALTGAAVAGKNNGVLALVNSFQYQAVEAAIGSPATSDISQGYVFGGYNVVTDFTLSYLNGEFTAASANDNPEELPLSDNGLLLRGSLNIQTAMDSSFIHGSKPS